MSKQRGKLAPLAHLLNESRSLIYMLDAQRSITFCNQSLLDWIRCDPVDLQGRIVKYHSGAIKVPHPANKENNVSPDWSDESLDLLAAGLCPPPEAWDGRETIASITTVDEHGFLRRRSARFFPLRNEQDESVGLVVFVEDQDLPDPLTPMPVSLPTIPSSWPCDESARLHELLQEFRTEMRVSYKVDRFIGRSPTARRARTQILLATQTSSSVAVWGPPGVGRQHAARAIHYGRAGDRRPGSLFPIDCAVLSADLIDSTIRALIAQHRVDPERGPSTILLTDVELLSADLQRTLLLCLNDSQFSFRIITTSLSSLSKSVESPTNPFRSDLAAALSPIEIALPPLLDRREDIPLLAQAFVEEWNTEHEHQLSGLTTEATELLDTYHWPLNIDELYETIAVGCAAALGPRLAASDLPDRIHYARAASRRPVREPESIDLDAYLANIEERLIRRALELSGGNRSKAAQLLSLNRPRLYRRMEQLGIE
jgi:transcriptional regulator of acetoin/glycerol metabolism